MAKLSLSNIGAGYSSVSTINANYALMEAAMENTLSRDGTTPNVMNANIDMNSAGRLVNLQDAVNNQEPVTLAQAAVIAGVTNPLTQDTVAAVLWPQSAIETANSETATELQHYYGNVERFGAKLDGATDDTAAFNSAIQSGYGAYCDQGVAAISGTIVLDGPSVVGNGGKSLTLTSWVTLQRFAGAATTPLIHVYGHRNAVYGNGATIRQNLYDHASGIVLLGGARNVIDTEVSQTSSTLNIIDNIKIVGPENTAQELETGSAGLYVNSPAKRKGDYIGDATYKNVVSNVQILNCDICIELSSDANANNFLNVHLHKWIKAAIFCNASYANNFLGMRLESPLENIIPSATHRFAIHLEIENAGVETNTHADYAIDAAFSNYFQGFAELPGAGNSMVALFTHTEAGTNFGKNVFLVNGTLIGGIGKPAGSSNNAALGTNTVQTPLLHKQKAGIIEINDYAFRVLDDGSGTYLSKDSFALITGRKTGVAEATTEDIFSVDGIGNNSAAAIIKVMYSATADSVASGQVGEVWWAVWIESSTGDRFVRKMSEMSTSFDEAFIVTPKCVTAASGQKMKATVSFLTAAPAGTNLFNISWKAEIVTSIINSGADFDANIKLL